MDTAITSSQTPPVELVTVSVNGLEMKLPKGKNLLAALLEEQIYIPHYCWHPSLSISGNCRLCLVEIEGQPRPSISCNMTCTDGLKIKTEGPMVDDCRKGMMEFLLVNHPLDCPVCDRGGECQLQRYSMQYGYGHARTVDERRRFPKPQFDPLIDIERNRCIMCTRCVRFMDEIAGHHTLAVFARGNRNYIGTFGDGPVSSVYSGNVIDICPVGCLTSKPFRFMARAWELQQVASTCTLCSSGCPTTTWLRDGMVMRVTPPARRYNQEYSIDEDTTQFICNEGRFGNYYANSPDRIRQAFARLDNKVETTSLDIALQVAAEGLTKAAAAGPDKVAILSGARSTNEETYLLSRLARSILGTHQIDGRLAYVSEEAAQMAGLALAASDGDLALYEQKGYEATLVINAPLQESVPIIGLNVKEAARKKLTRLAILDVKNDDWLEHQATAVRLTDPEKLASEIDALVDGIASNNGNSPEDLKAVQNAIGGAKTGLIVLGLDTAGGGLNAQLLPAIFRLLQKLGSGWHFLPVFEGRNSKGVFISGGHSDRLPGGELGADSVRNTLSELWGESKADIKSHARAESSPTALEILRRAADGKIQALLLNRCDELVHHPMRALIEKALDATPLVIAIDTYPSWITEKASVILPGALFYETNGSMISADGTLQSLIQGNQPPGDAQENWRLILALSGEGGTASRHDNAGKIFRELLLCWKAPRRFSLEDLKLDSPGSESPQRAMQFLGKKTRPTFKLHFTRPELNGEQIQARAAGVQSNPKDKLRLVWFNAIQGPDHLTSRSKEFDDIRPLKVIELNPQDALARGLQQGDAVRIEGCRAEDCKVRHNASLPRGVAYGGANTLGLQLPDGDPNALPLIDLVKIAQASPDPAERR